MGSTPLASSAAPCRAIQTDRPRRSSVPPADGSSDLLTFQGEKGISTTDTLPVLSAAEVRTRLESIITDAIDMLDALDAQHADMEPDVEGEAEPDEASIQPTILTPDWIRPVMLHRPSPAEMRAAYRRNGDPVPANLRGLFGRAFA
jgi:hypothetical protein